MNMNTNTINPRGFYTPGQPMEKIPFKLRRSHFLWELTKLCRKYRMYLSVSRMVDELQLDDINDWAQQDIDASFYTPHDNVYGGNHHGESIVSFISPHYRVEWASYFGLALEEPKSAIGDTEGYASEPAEF